MRSNFGTKNTVSYSGVKFANYENIKVLMIIISIIFPSCITQVSPVAKWGGGGGTDIMVGVRTGHTRKIKSELTKLLIKGRGGAQEGVLSIFPPNSLSFLIFYFYRFYHPPNKWVVGAAGDHIALSFTFPYPSLFPLPAI